MMISERKNQFLLTGIIILLNVLAPCRIFACRSNLQAIDMILTKQGFDSMSIQIKDGNQKFSANFYKSDSIFSFQSQKGYIPSLYSNFEEQLVAPFKFKTKQWLITGAAVGITAILLHFDNDIDKWATVQKQKHEWVNKSSPVITQFGSVYGWSTVATIGLASAIFKNEKGVQTSLLATQALITSGAWVQLIKHFTGREDPSASYIYSKKPGGKWWGPFAQYDQDLPVYKSVTSFDAFPSGHTAAAFSIATVFATQYSNIKAVPIICYSMATLVGVSRLTEHAHWSSDVFVGALFGYVCGKEVVSHYNKTNYITGNSLKSNSKVRIELTLIQDGDRAGLLLKW
jgi:membrane-associated phospholipid phosphatase